MHFYKFNIKDYAVNTSHLSNEEDLAYRRMLDLYYTDEQPLANDYQKLSRRLRIAADVVEVVLNEFFELTETGWVCSRVEEEIQSYHRICGSRKEFGIKGAEKRHGKSQARAKQKPSKSQANATIPLTTNQYISPIVPTGDMMLEVEEATKPEEEHPHLGRLRALFRIRPDTPLDSSSLRAWEKNKKTAAALTEEDWQSLEWAYRQKEGVAAQFRRKDLSTLLNNLLAEVTRARDWATRSGYCVRATAPVSMEPDGWRDLIEADYPEVNLSTWAALPESMKAWVREKQRALSAA
jgi:uncharacterized protein YdaU (DUF1376 family)